MKLKEKYGYICSDLMKEFERYDTKVKDEATGKMIQNTKYWKKFVHKTVSGKMVNLDVGYERFLGPEMLFHPEFMNAGFQSPLEEVVDNAIQKCPVDYRQKLYANVVLSGGNTLFKGFDARLGKNLQQILNNR